jgi:uncharacterized membrane protein
MDNLSNLFRHGAQALVTLVEGVGVVIVAIAVVLALGRYVTGMLARAQPFPPERLRLELGRSLGLSREFLLGADILHTAVEPTWEVEVEAAPSTQPLEGKVSLLPPRHLRRSVVYTGHQQPSRLGKVPSCPRVCSRIPFQLFDRLGARSAVPCNTRRVLALTRASDVGVICTVPGCAGEMQIWVSSASFFAEEYNSRKFFSPRINFSALGKGVLANCTETDSSALGPNQCTWAPLSLLTSSITCRTGTFLSWAVSFLSLKRIFTGTVFGAAPTDNSLAAKPTRRPNNRRFSLHVSHLTLARARSMYTTPGDLIDRNENVASSSNANGER